ncbi:unnamed protein product [Sphenostylis stenocarpa]|uniref:Importin-7/11-like TPR repeats domain-containing protein n=1 Tax=Sphenostylis stenocarpa TaxID=92480 RepID=A0AA86SBA8_9FABA|nr:unnamed protein product [Sphenostylis stenocarpa]
MCFNDNDQKLWDEDPHEYVRKGYASAEYKPYRQKDGALLAIGALCDKLKQTEPYKSELERMLVQHVFPEFSSPVGHLRAKAAWVAGQYAHINFSDQNNFRRALQCVVSRMQDSELPVRVDSVFALRSFIEACKDLNEIRPILPQLLDEFFKLMNEVENEDLVFTLETIVDKFGEEMAPYALGLCQNLAAAFWRCMNTAEADDEADDPGALAAVGCLRAISTILESVSRLPHLFVQIEPTLLPIMRRMLTTDGQEVFEEVLEIVSYMTFFSPTISLDMWSLWPLMIEALADWAIDFFPTMVEGNFIQDTGQPAISLFFSLTLVCNGFDTCSGLFTLNADILVPLDNYISRGTAQFLSCKEPDYQQSLWNMISSIMSDKNMEDNDIVPAPKLIEVVFQNCRGHVDHWVEPYLRITVERLRHTEKSYLKCLFMQVIADALYYNAALTLGILQKLGVASEIFHLWFQLLQQVKKSGMRANFKREHEKKVCCLGLTSLLSLPADQLPAEALGRVFRANLDLLVAYKDQVAEAAKEEEAEDDDDMDGFQTDDEDEDGNGFDKEMGVDADDGEDTDTITLRKLAEQVCSYDDLKIICLHIKEFYGMPICLNELFSSLLLQLSSLHSGNILLVLSPRIIAFALKSAKSFRPNDEDDDDSDDDYSDDEELHSPIDEIDPFILFVDTIKENAKLKFKDSPFSCWRVGPISFSLSRVFFTHRTNTTPHNTRCIA